MDKYKKLLSNTIVFAIGTFASKALVFLLMPLYTRVLTNEQYGSADLIVQTANLLIPFVSAGLFNAVIRFGLGKNSDRRGVFSICIVSIMCGFMLLLAASPLLSNIQGISGYTSLICAYVLCSCLHSICAQFIRARQMVRLFAIDGIFCTVLTILFNILFLVVFDMGVMGYVLATVLADIICAVSLFLVASLWKYFDLRSINKPLALSMLKYALPLIPTSVFWWITNVSDRYMVTYMVSLEAEGLYAAAYKIPTIFRQPSVSCIHWRQRAYTHLQINHFHSCLSRFLCVMGIYPPAYYGHRMLLFHLFFGQRIYAGEKER